MKKTISRVIKACETLIMASFFFGCSMMMDEMGNGGASSSSVQDIRSMMNRSDAERLLYMGGSVLYSPKDSNANQLIEGAVVATRIGKVIKKDLGCGCGGEDPGGQYYFVPRLEIWNNRAYRAGESGSLRFRSGFLYGDSPLSALNPDKRF